MINSDTPAPASPRAGVLAAHAALIAAEAAHDRAFGVRFPDGCSARIVAKQAEDQARIAYIAAAEAYFAADARPGMRVLLSILASRIAGHDARHDPRPAPANARPGRMFR